MKFLKLIRYQNLLLIALMQLVLRYGFLQFQNIPLTLSDWQFGLLILATLCIAAGGYVINDIMDQETDAINKPEKVVVGKSITEEVAYNWYFGFNIVGMLLGYYLADFVNKTSFFGIFIISSALLYLYATSLKQIAIVGNIIVALVLAFSVIVVGLFDVLPMMNYAGMELWANMKIILSIITDYAIFAFIINLIRELVKDAQDIEGDQTEDIRTLPVIIGIAKTTKVIFALALMAIGLLAWYINDHLMNNQLYPAVIYSLILVIGPMIFFLVKIWSAKTKEDFALLSKVLKYVILFGVLSVVVINYNIKLNG